jgi:hypothetical protein
MRVITRSKDGTQEGYQDCISVPYECYSLHATKSSQANRALTQVLVPGQKQDSPEPQKDSESDPHGDLDGRPEDGQYHVLLLEDDTIEDRVS